MSTPTPTGESGYGTAGQPYSPPPSQDAAGNWSHLPPAQTPNEALQCEGVPGGFYLTPPGGPNPDGSPPWVPFGPEADRRRAENDAYARAVEAGGKRTWFARHRLLTTLGAVVAVLVVLGIIGSAIGGGDRSPVPAPAATASEVQLGTPSGDNGIQATTPPPPDLGHTPTARDFRLAVKVLSRECFGEAGCNVTYRVSLDYAGAQDLPDGSSYEVTYQVVGPQDGPQINTLTTHGMQYDVPDEELAQVPSARTKLTVKVTQVDSVS